MTTAPLPNTARLLSGRTLAAYTWQLTRSRWVWTPAAVGTVGFATATVALGRALTAPPQPRRKTRWPVRLDPAGADAVRLRGPAAGVGGRWGLRYDGGDGIVDEPLLGAGIDDATRRFTLLSGAPPDTAAGARLHAHVWPDLEAFIAATGIGGYEVVVEGETGPLPAWVLPAGDGRRWCVLVHGRGASRSQMLRLVPTLHARGITAMVISYRNDAADCTDPSGRMHYGQREWRDLEAAMLVARRAGAHQFLLAGMSMGGAIIATLLRRSSLAPRVVAAVLDSPALNWGAVLRHVARGWRLPQWVVPGVMTVAGWQARIDWKALNHLGAGDRLTTPVFLVHGDRDPVVPVEMSDAYAQAEPDLVTYLRIEGAGHVSSWNTAPEQYDRALGAFLDGPAARAFAAAQPPVT